MGDALAAFARPRMLSCAARALGIPIIACFHIPTISQCAAQAAPVPRFAFQTYAVRDLCEKDFAGTLKAAAETAWIDESISTAGAALVEEYKSAASQFKGKKKEEPAPNPRRRRGFPCHNENHLCRPA